MENYRLKTIDISLLKDIFDMHGGYVLNFSNPTFAEFFALELKVDIYADKYGVEGNSKAKRLLCFLKKSRSKQAANAIVKLWNLRETTRLRANEEEKFSYTKKEIKTLVSNLRGTPTNSKKTPSTPKKTEPSNSARSELRSDLLAVSKLAPHDRGFAFEKFLNSAFQAYGLIPRPSFKISGEQIDGSFVLNGDIYLVEAKWQQLSSGANELYAFNGKVENKTAWTRGLFISYSGFSVTGVDAFTRAKSIICMDGLDLHSCLEGKMELSDTIFQKVRRASESGQVFVPYSELLQK